MPFINLGMRNHKGKAFPHPFPLPGGEGMGLRKVVINREWFGK